MEISISPSPLSESKLQSCLQELWQDSENMVYLIKELDKRTEDCLMDKEEERSTSDGISSEMLTEIMEKSVRIFWNFIKADKSETNGILKGILQTETELQDQKDLERLIVIKADLQKVAFKLISNFFFSFLGRV